MEQKYFFKDQAKENKSPSSKHLFEMFYLASNDLRENT